MLLFTHHYPETYKPKFHCRRQSGINFGYVTMNGLNSNKLSLYLKQISAIFIQFEFFIFSLYYSIYIRCNESRYSYIVRLTRMTAETYKPKFHCRRQSGVNFGYVTENGVNSNILVTTSSSIFLLSLLSYQNPLYWESLRK